jgi:hypothetical protein
VFDVLVAAVLAAIQKIKIHTEIHHHRNHHHHISVMELGHFMTRSGLTFPEVSSMVSMIPSTSRGVVFHYPG